MSWWLQYQRDRLNATIARRLLQKNIILVSSLSKPHRRDSFIASFNHVSAESAFSLKKEEKPFQSHWASMERFFNSGTIQSRLSAGMDYTSGGKRERSIRLPSVIGGGVWR